MKSYLLRHLQVLLDALGRLVRSPLPALLTVAVLGVALALPTGLLVLLDNMGRALAGWDGRAQISAFVAVGTPEEEARALFAHIAERDDVAAVSYVSADAALQELRALAGFGPALDAMGDNPLPAMIVVQPGDAVVGEARLQALVEALAGLPQVDSVQLELEWLRRLNALLVLARRAGVLLAVLLALGVVLIVSNTTRLAVLNRRDEIEIIDRVGGTAAFIRRPFLYTGLVQGLLGALAAWGLVSVGLALLSGPTAELAALYGGGFRLQGVGAPGVLMLLFCGAVLGWAAARVTVAWQLRGLRPS
ncbi:MAG: cell division protein [Gammaproteobacteria bacterium]|nr:cell division protein [Gammaproteobacteria bacterium]